MKKTLLSVAAMLIAGLSFGQVKWGVVAGPNFSSVTQKYAGDKETSSLLVGVRAGITADLPLADEFFIGTGLLYAGKGGKNKDNSDFKTTLSYLQLPILFTYKPQVGTGNLVLGVGPYLAYGLGGKHKGGIGNLSGDLKAFDDESGAYKLSRFDAGAGIQVGYELPQGLYFGLNTDLGLVNVASEKEIAGEDFSWKNTSFGVSVGYKFGGR
ncbi:porin family protein [Chitinophaga japonensis]|uniref:Outer membrane protein with beta-barrel domain n=1 Tax=Chitinophaga japonensis TaxID=104662 RepID=A0A562TEN2_CHIJA|nr:porin family protein [Chitinophaga japonensis]TWI91843.1 outer membrane protein with beta-barrel domain [Chitinophaga japonensis]